jgi:hypothetical protein
MQGQLFTQDFLLRGIRDTPPYQALDDAGFVDWRTGVVELFTPLAADSTLNEAQTEQQLIHPLLHLLGWAGNQLPQVNLSKAGREDVPDLLLFADATAWPCSRPSAGCARSTAATPLRQATPGHHRRRCCVT